MPAQNGPHDDVASNSGRRDRAKHGKRRTDYHATTWSRGISRTESFPISHVLVLVVRRQHVHLELLNGRDDKAIARGVPSDVWLHDRRGRRARQASETGVAESWVRHKHSRERCVVRETYTGYVEPRKRLGANITQHQTRIRLDRAKSHSNSCRLHLPYCTILARGDSTCNATSGHRKSSVVQALNVR